MNSINLLLLLWAALFDPAANRRMMNAIELIQTVGIQQQEHVEGESSQTRMDFKEVMMGENMSKDGTRYPFHSWKSADGITVTSYIMTFDSVPQARKAFSGRLSEASQVIERTQRINRANRKTGDRAVVLFSYQDKGKESQFAAILWTEGRALHDVESVSLRHAQAFEREFYPISNGPIPNPPK